MAGERIPCQDGERRLKRADRQRLSTLLDRARRYGFLGPGEVGDHISHALAFLELCPEEGPRRLDLGSGAGVPGLVLAIAQPRTTWVLLEANKRRAAFLASAIEELGLEARVRADDRRAEQAGRGPMRASMDVVVARGFARPSTTIECAAPLLRPGGALVVAEPPGAPERWPANIIEQLGMTQETTVVEPFALRRFRLVTPCPERYPRRDGMPSKRPLF